MINIYTDGACRNNQAKTETPASWAMAVYRDTEYLGKQAGILLNGTNNKGELEAVIRALSWCVRHNITDAVIHTDSAYVVNGCNIWVHNWVNKGWKTSTNTPVKNANMWKQVAELLERIDPGVSIVKIKGHSGHFGNDKADSLCNEELDKWSKING